MNCHRSGCAECGAPFDTWQGKPDVVDGRVRLRCPSCAAGRHDMVPPAAEVIATPTPMPALPRAARRHLAATVIVVALSSIAVVALAMVRSETPEPATAPAAPKIAAAEAPAVEPKVTVKLEPPVIVPEPRPQWMHPLPDGSHRYMPSRPTSRFGAERPGDRPGECGRGHCGIDLVAERGWPVVSVKPGVVIKVVRSDDDRGGRRVVVEHERGYCSHYMHLDDVRDDLEPGTPVLAGEFLGSLGKSGIHRSEPHLHFGISLTDEQGTRFVDPEPILANAGLMELWEMIADSSP